MCCTQYASKFEKLSSGHRTKGSVFIPVLKKSNAKECSNYCTTVLISHASKVVLKILETRLQQHVNWELPGIQAGFKKAEEPEIKLPALNDLDSIIKNQRHYFDDKDPYSQSYGFSCMGVKAEQ